MTTSGGSEWAEADQEVGRLLRAYADVATRMDWDGYGEVVLDDAPLTFEFGDRSAGPITVTGAAGLRRLGEAALAGYDFYFYAPLQHVLASVDAGRAAGRAYALETTLDRQGTWTDVYGTYEDEYVRTDAGWRIAARRYRELRRRVAQP